MRRWVCGFLFDEPAHYVMLIRKNRPEWQAGKLNGIGGKVEPGEALPAAMRREFHEETGVRVAPAGTVDGHHFADLCWEEGIVHFFRAFAPLATLERCRSMTDESVERHIVHKLGMPGPGLDNVVPNLLWLVPLAAHRDDTYDLIDVVETGSTMAKPGRLDVHPGGRPR